MDGYHRCEMRKTKNRRNQKVWVCFPQGLAGSIHDIAGSGNCKIKKVTGSYREVLHDSMDTEYSDDTNEYSEFGCLAF